MVVTQVPQFVWTGKPVGGRVKAVLQTLIAEKASIAFLYERDREMYFTGIPVTRQNMSMLMRAVSEVFGVPEPREGARPDKPVRLYQYILRNRPVTGNVE